MKGGRSTRRKYGVCAVSCQEPNMIILLVGKCRWWKELVKVGSGKWESEMGLGMLTSCGNVGEWEAW